MDERIENAFDALPGLPWAEVLDACRMTLEVRPLTPGHTNLPRLTWRVEGESLVAEANGVADLTCWLDQIRRATRELQAGVWFARGFFLGIPVRITAPASPNSLSALADIPEAPMEVSS